MTKQKAWHRESLITNYFHSLMRSQCCDLDGSDGAAIGSPCLETGYHSVSLSMWALGCLNDRAGVGVCGGYCQGGLSTR